MDTIDVTHWNQYFGDTQQKVVYNSDRYAHFEVSFEQTALASGNISAINTPDMIFSDLKIEATPPFRLQDLVPKESAESVFVIEGNVESHFTNIDRPLFFGSRQHNLQYNTEFAGTHTIHTPRFHVCTITYHKAFLSNLMENDSTGALAAFCRHLQSESNFLGVADAIHWQQRIAELIQVIQSCPFSGVTRYIFTESKLLELFVLQMDQFHTIHLNPSAIYWSPGDKEKLYAVNEYISNFYLEPLSLKMLSTRFGLNEYKLKKGYKYFFQTTVFGEIHRLRMQEARRLLQQRTMNITEVAYHIGYNNLSSFCFAFKKMFGYNAGKNSNR